MDFVLALTLILAFLSIGESYTEGTEQTSKDCYELCPPGYHKEGDCDHPVAKYRCKKCTGPTYTALHNYIQKCERCGSCARNEVTIKPCTFNSNVVCDCKDGFYNANPKTDRRCLPCPQNSKDKEDGQFNRLIQKCLTNPECERICLTTTSTFMTATVSNSASLNPAVDPVQVNSASYLTLIILVLVVVTVLGFFWLLIRNPSKYSDSCPCCGMNKDPELPAEDPEFSEQHSHQGCSPTTLKFNISEETSMMTLSQSPEHPAHISPLVPDTEHKAARRQEQSEHWPAIVLYTIIREVPLRRWKEFLRLLSVADQQLERVELEAGLGLGFTERQYQMLRLWSQRSSASLSDVFSALHYMDLSGCAQLLQESLEKLQWQPEPM